MSARRIIMKLQEMKKLKLNEKVFGEKGILRDTVYMPFSAENGNGFLI